MFKSKVNMPDLPIYRTTHKFQAGKMIFGRGSSHRPAIENTLIIVVVIDDCGTIDIANHVNSDKIWVHNFLFCNKVMSAGASQLQNLTTSRTGVQVQGRKCFNISDLFYLPRKIGPPRKRQQHGSQS
jgi:hypothetical protein